jgi:biopolymer transport protein TolR
MAPTQVASSPVQTLSAAQRSQIRRLSRPSEPEPGEEAGELNIVPYLDIITNIMMFVLASVAVAFASTIHVQATPVTPGKIGPVVSGLRLTALVSADGVGLSTADGHVAAGCDGLGGGVTVPKRAGEHDFTGLGACARKLKEAHPVETVVAVSASPDVPYATVIAVMDALRSDEAGELFPEARLGVVR